MSAIKRFCIENELHTMPDRTVVTDGCGTILDFMHEFGFQFSEDDFNYVQKLHDGTSSEIDLWQKSCSRKMWLSNLQSIKLFPSYSVFKEYKSILKATITEWVKSL